MADKAGETRPRLRGWMHAGAMPLLIAASVVLVVLSPTSLTRWGSSVYVASGRCCSSASRRPTTEAPGSHGCWAFWRRFDHANIYVLIAGTYTPFALLYLDGAARAWLLGIVWGVALVGLVLRLALVRAPRWVFTPLYVALAGRWRAVRPAVRRGRRPVPGLGERHSLEPRRHRWCALHARRAGVRHERPNPSPEWFGFHEVFHLFTVLAFVAQYVAVSVVTYSL